MAWIGVVDIAGFRGAGGEIIVKELGVCTFLRYTLNYAAYTSCVFAPAYELDPRQQPIQLCNKDGAGNCHGIPWACGNVQLSQLAPILNRAVAHVARLCCKGAAEEAFIKSLLED